jgi:hypothetical protein
MPQNSDQNTVRARSLVNIESLMACRTSERLVNFGLLTGAHSCARIASLTISITARSDGSCTGWNWDSRLSARASAFSKSDRASPPSTCKGGDGVRNRIAVFVIFYSVWFSQSSIPACHPTVHSSTWSADKSPTFGGGWSGFSGRPRDLPLPDQPFIQALFYPEY